MGIFATPDQLPQAPVGPSDWLKHVEGRTFAFHDGKRLDPPAGAEVLYQAPMAGKSEGQRPHGGQYLVTLGPRQAVVSLGCSFAEAEAALARLAPKLDVTAPVAGLKELDHAASEGQQQRDRERERQGVDEGGPPAGASGGHRLAEGGEVEPAEKVTDQ